MRRAAPEAVTLDVSVPSREAERMPIEELSRRTGVTVRNLRALHSRGLLAPPELVGRKGFYTERHVARVLLVLKLQSRGFSLAAIQALVEGWEKGGGLMDVMGLEDALTTPGTPGPRREVDVEQAFPELLGNNRALAKALDQQLVIRKDGRIVAPDAELLDIVRQQVAAGFPLVELLEDGDALLADLDRIAARFRQRFFEHVADKYLRPGTPGSGMADVAEKVALLRPLSVRLVTILMARAIERGGGAPAGDDAKADFSSDGSKRPAPARATRTKRTRARASKAKITKGRKR